jgi:hypothetical protein
VEPVILNAQTKRSSLAMSFMRLTPTNAQSVLAPLMSLNVRLFARLIAVFPIPIAKKQEKNWKPSTEKSTPKQRIQSHFNFLT